jgi:predicted membrane GTPase involved in stress response
VEVTPETVRLRKTNLEKTARVKAARQSKTAAAT